MSRRTVLSDPYPTEPAKHDGDHFGHHTTCRPSEHTPPGLRPNR
jgi:hypothetical protein